MKIKFLDIAPPNLNVATMWLECMREGHNISIKQVHLQEFVEHLH
jgi:hypothetical protein